jgi:hypothetical protein
LADGDHIEEDWRTGDKGKREAEELRRKKHKLCQQNSRNFECGFYSLYNKHPFMWHISFLFLKITQIYYLQLWLSEI